MLHEKINLGNSGYGTRDTILTTYVQNNLEGVPARRRPAVIIVRVADMNISQTERANRSHWNFEKRVSGIYSGICSPGRE